MNLRDPPASALELKACATTPASFKCGKLEACSLESVSNTVELAVPELWRPQHSGLKLAKRSLVSAAAIPGPTARLRYDLGSPSRTKPGRSAGAGAGRGTEQRLSSKPRIFFTAQRHHDGGCPATEQGGEQLRAPGAPGAISRRRGRGDGCHRGAPRGRGR